MYFNAYNEMIMVSQEVCSVEEECERGKDGEDWLDKIYYRARELLLHICSIPFTR